MRARKAFLVFSALLVGAAAAAGCGGSSSRTAGDDGDQAGAGGDAGSGDRGGSSNGGTGAGGSSTGGMSTGGMSTGGMSTGGMSTGGISTGGISTGGISTGGMSTGGVAGTSAGTGGGGGICSLPLVTGSCQAYFPSFGFSTTTGNCVPFVYGGCGGNDNRFATLVECEAACGGPRLSDCPETAPDGLECPEEGKVCTYDFENCLCAPTIVGGPCSKVDSGCALRPDAGVSPIVVASYKACTCSSGKWTCVFTGPTR
jgi:hypothetical protein